MNLLEFFAAQGCKLAWLSFLVEPELVEDIILYVHPYCCGDQVFLIKFLMAEASQFCFVFVVCLFNLHRI